MISNITVENILHKLLPNSYTTLIAHSSWVTSVAYLPSGNAIVSGSQDSTVSTWRYATQGKCYV